MAHCRFVSDQHGTLALKSDAPSQPATPETFGRSVFASYGYAVVVPDYLGLGSSPGYQALSPRTERSHVRRGRSASGKISLRQQ